MRKALGHVRGGQAIGNGKKSPKHDKKALTRERENYGEGSKETGRDDELLVGPPSPRAECPLPVLRGPKPLLARAARRLRALSRSPVAAWVTPAQWLLS